MRNLKNAKNISEHLLNDGFHVRVNTNGGSMFPVVSTGDRVVICRASNLKVGDIVVFKRKEEIVCHRLTKIFERDGIRHFQTQGDSFFGADEPITAGQIVGRVIRIDREKVSRARWALLLIQPLLRKGRLNAFVVSALIRMKKIICSCNSHA